MFNFPSFKLQSFKAKISKIPNSLENARSKYAKNLKFLQLELHHFKIPTITRPIKISQ